MDNGLQYEGSVRVLRECDIKNTVRFLLVKPIDKFSRNKRRKVYKILSRSNPIFISFLSYLIKYSIIIVVRILVTGGAGFLGLHLDSYLSKNHNLTLVDIQGFDKSEYATDSRIEICDVRNKRKLDGLIKGQDIIIHAAAALLWKKRYLYYQYRWDKKCFGIGKNIK